MSNLLESCVDSLARCAIAAWRAKHNTDMKPEEKEAAAGAYSEAKTDLDSLVRHIVSSKKADENVMETVSEMKKESEKKLEELKSHKRACKEEIRKKRLSESRTKQRDLLLGALKRGKTVEELEQEKKHLETVVANGKKAKETVKKYSLERKQKIEALAKPLLK